jgi:hypothetical protein
VPAGDSVDGDVDDIAGQLTSHAGGASANLMEQDGIICPWSGEIK